MRAWREGLAAGFLLLGLTPVCHPSVMFRRRIVQELGGYDEAFAPAEDVELWVRLAIHRHYAGVIPEPLVLSRMHPGQQSVIKAQLQQRNLWRAQERLLARFCPEEARAAMASLWRRDEQLWHWCGSKARWVWLCDALGTMIDNLQFSPEERLAFVKLMDRWLGPGVRAAGRLAAWPAWAFYPALVALSPLLVPGVRGRLSRVVGQLRRLRSDVAAERPGSAVSR